MARKVPAELANEIKWLSRLLIEKGDGEPRHATKLMQAMEAGSPVLDTAIKTAIANCLGRSAMDEITQDEKERMGLLMEMAQNWRAGKPGPPKRFPVVISLRMTHEEKAMLSEIADREGWGESDVLRRCIREAHGS